VRTFDIEVAMLRFLLPGALLFALAAAPGVGAADVADTFRDRVMPVLSAHCTSCHGGEKPKAKLNLSGPRSRDQLRGDAGRWVRVLEQIESGVMPPEGRKPLSPEERQAVAGWIRGEFSDWLASEHLKAGRSKFRRLSRAEYANTISDLFGIRPPVVRDLPVDGRVDGYDKLSTALPFSSASAAGYLKITEEILSRFLLPSAAKQDRTFRLGAVPSEQSKGHILELEDGTMVSFNTDTTSGPLRKRSPDGKLQGFPGPRIPGLHRLRLSVYAYQTDKPLTFGIYAGHVWAYPQMIELLKVLEAPPGKPTILETEVYLRTGRDSDLSIDDGIRLIPFGLGVQVPKNSLASKCTGPGLAVQWVDVEEPELPLPGDRWLCTDMTPAIREAFLRPGATLQNVKFPRGELLATVRKTFARVGARLFRRDLTETELSNITSNFTAHIDGGWNLRTAFLEEISTLLTSPDFLCVIEKPGTLTDFALASRLSYFLWNSTPDEALLDVARTGRLTDSTVLREQTERLLNDPKSRRFVNSFADQWLGLWAIDNTTPDKDLYPEYDDVLKISSVMETQATLQKMLDKNLSVRDFAAPNWAMVNERLAQHYGLSGVKGFSLRQAPLPADSPYGGLWTQAATMKVTANGTLTSPVKRGVWVVERLLGTPIPPPPPNIEPVDPDTRGAKTLREQLALHSSGGSCKACHARFDPYGFALESFDVMGAFRTRYRETNPEFAKIPESERKGRLRWRDGLPVNCTGRTLDGAAFSGIGELRQMLARNPEALARGVTRHLIIYSTGAPTAFYDQHAIDSVVRSSSPENYGLRSLVRGVVQSELFRSK
jgi:mono/diheme cytochrome c family protein